MNESRTDSSASVVISVTLAGAPLTLNVWLAFNAPTPNSSVYSPAGSCADCAALTLSCACGAPLRLVSSGSLLPISAPSSSPSLRSGQVTAIALSGTRLPSGPVIFVAP